MMNSRLQLRRYANQENRRLRAYERKYAKRILTVLNRQLDEAVRNSQYGAMFLDMGMNEAISDLYKDVGVNTANDQFDALQSFKTKASNFFLNTWMDFMVNYILSSMAMRVTSINDTTRKKIQDTIAMGYNLGMQTEDIARFLRQRVGKLNVYRSIMIARTEIAEAANIAKDKSAEDWKDETGEERLWKVWIHRFANEPRTFHLEMDNNRAIPEDEPFQVRNPVTGGVDLMMRPHDPAGGAAQNVNCSCTVVYVSESYARQLNSGR